MRLFDSVKMYVFTFCILALSAVPKVYQVTYLLSPHFDSTSEARL